MAFAKNENVKAEQGSTHGQPFLSLRGEIDLLSGDLADTIALLQGQIDDLVASQAEQDTVIAALQGAVSLLEGRVLQNETDIAALEAWHEMQDELIDMLFMKLDALEVRVAANEDDIAAIILADQVMQQMIAAIKQDISVLQQMVARNTGDIAGHTTQLEALQDELAGLQTELAAKQDRVDGVCSPGSAIRRIFSDGNVQCEEVSGTPSLFPTTVDRSQTVPSSVDGPQAATLLPFCPFSSTVSGAGYSVGGGSFGLGGILLNRAASSFGWSFIALFDGVGETTVTVEALCLRIVEAPS